MKPIENTGRIVAVVVIALLLVAFLWDTQHVLSPILLGGILVFLLAGLRRRSLVGRLGLAVVLILLVWFFVKAKGVIFPFVASFVLAYLFDPVADLLERWRIPRTLGILFLLLGTVGLIVLMGMILIPGLVEEIHDLISRIPNMADQVTAFVQKTLPKVLTFFRIDTTKFEEYLLESFPNRAEQVLSNLLKGVTGVGAFLGQILNVILIPILTFYFLKDFNRIREWLLNVVPRKYRSSCYFYLWRTNRILGGYIRGQLIVCTIVGVLTGLGLAVFGIPFAILLGVMTGLLNVIPYIGLYVSLGLALLTSLFTAQPLVAALKIAGVFLVVQLLEGYVIAPKIVGERVGLHPLAVIFSVLVFSRFLGFWGLIIGVPTAALIKFLLDEAKRRQRWKEILAEKIGPKD